MSEKAAKGLFFFLLTMVVFTFFSWKLDILRTPQALCVQPVQMELAGKDYHFVLPAEAASGEGVWVAGESKSVFYPYTARWGRVTAGASEGGWTAVDGISDRSQVVWFSDRTLAGGGTVPVRLWEERPLAGRVEVLCPAEGEAALREAMVRYEKEWDLSWEEDRLVVENVDLFTAQQVEAALRQAGVEAWVLDYAWGPAVLSQSQRLWLAWAAILGLFILGSLAWNQGKRELERVREGLEDSYLSGYWEANGVRLLAKAIALAEGTVGALLLLRWLWEVPVELPRGFLPEGSIFDGEHYRQWLAAAFPEERLSDYAANLAQDIRRGCLLSAAVCAGLTLLVVIGEFIRRRGRKGGTI